MWGYNYIREIQKVLTSAKTDALLAKFSEENQIKWKFIPSLSPHQGGICEATIK